MKTPEQLKQLAEWSAEFLGMEKNGKFWLLPGQKVGHSTRIESQFFEYPTKAPILMHLAQVELEKRKQWMDMRGPMRGGWRVSCEIEGSVRTVTQKHENKYIAFWSAVREAMK